PFGARLRIRGMTHESFADGGLVAAVGSVSRPAWTAASAPAPGSTGAPGAAERLRRRRQFPGRRAPGALPAADVNGDGRPDLVVANGNAGVSVLLGNGDGSFQDPLALMAGSNPHAVAVGDVNSDGRVDLLVANAPGGTVRVL